MCIRDRRRKAVYGKTRAAVAAKLTSVLKASQDGTMVPSDQLTVERFLKRWLDGHKAAVRHRTWVRYEGLIRLHALPFIGSRRLNRLEPHHIQSLYTERLGTLAPASVRQLHAVLRRALDDAFKWDLVTRNVATLVNPPRVPRFEIRPWSSAQANAFLTAARGDRFEALYVTAVTTGMREGELLGLHWKHVDLEQGHIQVLYSLEWQTGGRYTLHEPKTHRSRRRIKMPAITIAALREHRARQAEERLRLGPNWNGIDLVFPNVLGGPMRPSNLIRNSFKPILRESGLPHIRFHDLRHTAATILLLNGVHPKVVSEMLGHASIQITLDTYSHVLPEMQAQATAAMDTAFGQF
jgi:integrase